VSASTISKLKIDNNALEADAAPQTMLWEVYSVSPPLAGFLWSERKRRENVGEKRRGAREREGREWDPTKFGET